jgi:hypothetical protein
MVLSAYGSQAPTGALPCQDSRQMVSSLAGYGGISDYWSIVEFVAVLLH